MENWFTVTQVKENIFSLAEFYHWEKVISYLIVDETQAFLIDTGMGYASIKEEIKKITSLPITVLLTHAHWDHIGGINEFQNVHLFNDNFERKGIQDGFNADQITELSNLKMFKRGFSPKKYVISGIKKYNLLEDLQTIQSNTFGIQVIHTPGHTPGSVCFFIPKLNALFTGDTLYPGPLYAQMPESNIQDYIFSIKKLQSCTGPGTKIYPGHNVIVSDHTLLSEVEELFSKAESNLSEAEVFSEHLSIKLK